MEQKDKTRKEELLKDFEDKWELEQDLLMSREGRKSLPTYYAAANPSRLTSCLHKNDPKTRGR